MLSTIVPERPERQWTQWVASAGIHVALLVVLLVIPVAVKQVTVQPARYATVSLIAPRMAQPLPLPKLRVIPVQTPVRTPVPVPTPVQVRRPAVIALKPAVTRPLAPPTIAPPPEIASARPAAPVIELKPIPSPVRTEVFAQANVPPAGTTPGVRPIQAGGFDLPSGSNHGGPGGTAKGVATGGFGDSAGAGNGIARASGGAQIHAAGFGDYNGPVVSPAGLKTASVKPAVTPVEITWKPQPAYTAEARERKLEGEVQLDVLFGAAGHIHVLRVVRGLGSGLDESATTAAEQIRFRPGTRDGSPVDMTGIVHIVFKLS